MRSCTSPAGRLESHQRGFWIETLVLCPGDLLSKSSNFFQKKVVGGQPPVNDRRVGGKHNTVKQADSGLGGWMLRKFQGEPLKPDRVLVFCQASFLMTLSQAEFLTLAPSKLPFFSLLFTFHVKILVVMSESSNLLKSKLARMSCAGLFHYVPHFGKPHLV